MKLILSSVALGIGLAMDACAVSMANGMSDKKLNVFKAIIIAFMFGLFQFLMPLLGYFISHTAYERFNFIEKYKLIPILALLILSFIGTKMIVESIKNIRDKSEKEEKTILFKLILIQAIATSIDALSVGIAIADYRIISAVICCIIVGIVTFIICLPSVYIGKSFGILLGNYAGIVGGIILVLIGFTIFFTGIF